MARGTLLRLLASTTALTAACGDGGSGPGAVSADVPTLTFSASGISPRSVAIANGGCVIVRNSDSSNHDVAADDLQTCPELLGTTTLLPTHEWEWCGFQGGPKTCGFHDPSRKLASGAPDPAFSATIDVGGYSSF